MSVDDRARLQGIANRLRRMAAGMTYGPQYDAFGVETQAGQIEAEVKFHLIELAGKIERVSGPQRLRAAPRQGKLDL